MIRQFHSFVYKIPSFLNSSISSRCLWNLDRIFIIPRWNYGSKLFILRLADWIKDIGSCMNWLQILQHLYTFSKKIMSLQFVILVYECIINFTKCELLSGKSVYVCKTCLTRPCFAPIAPYRNTICRCTFHRCAFYHGSSGKVIIACNLIVDFIYLSRGIMSAILDPVLPGNRRICLHRWFRLTYLFWDVFVPGFRGREHFQGLISL